MKLGFVLKITNGGESEAYSINKSDSWALYATDARSAIKELTNFDETEKIVYLVKFLGVHGYLLCVIKARPQGSGRPNDNTAAWIHIPSNVDISSEETINILNVVEDAISEDKGTNYELLERQFTQEYDSKSGLLSAIESIVSKNDSTFAIRYYNGDYTLHELLGANIAQQEYGKYKGIILVDKSQNIISSSVQELNFEPKQICTIAPLSPIDGFTPCFCENGLYQPFNRPIEVPIGTKITIHWVKEGYSTISKTFIAQNDLNCYSKAKISPAEYKIIVYRKMFYVTDHHGKPVNSFEIKINNKSMDGDSMEILEASLKQGVSLVISSKGFSEWREKKVYLINPMNITLKKKTYQYNFSIPVYDEGKDTKNDATITVKTTKRIDSSPIKGYVSNDRIYEGEGNVNRLFYDDNWKVKLKYFLYGVLSVFAIGFLYAGITALDDYEFNFGWPPLKKENPMRTNTNSVDTAIVVSYNVDADRAVEYLEKNEIWHMDSLDSNDFTKGMFEEMNEFKFGELIQRVDRIRSNSQKTSTKLQELKNSINNSQNSGVNPHIGKEKQSGRYNSNTDKGINFKKYIEWISFSHSPSIEAFSDDSPNPPAKSSQTIKTQNNHIKGDVKVPKQEGQKQPASNPFKDIKNKVKQNNSNGARGEEG